MYIRLKISRNSASDDCYHKLVVLSDEHIQFDLLCIYLMSREVFFLLNTDVLMEFIFDYKMQNLVTG